MQAIRFFKPDEAWGELSNFFALSEPLRVRDDRNIEHAFATSEHLYHFRKFSYAGASEASRAYADVVRRASTPYKAKILAQMREVTQYQWQRDLSSIIAKASAAGVAPRAEWDAIKIEQMYEVVLVKFQQNAHCRAVLVERTGNLGLVEASPYDSFWAIGKGGGRNELGKILEQVRAVLRQEAPAAAASASIFVPERNDPFFSKPRPVCEPRPHQPVVDLADLVREGRWAPLEHQPNAEDLVKLRQGLLEWFRQRWGHATSSRLLRFLGWLFRRASPAEVAAEIYKARDELQYEMEHEFEQRDMEFKDDRDKAVGKERMAHGVEHEDDGVITLLYHRPTLKLRECVLQPMAGVGRSSLFYSSQDAAGIDAQGRRISVEVKCRYWDRDPQAFDGVKDYYVPQMCAHMGAEDSVCCYFVSWGPDTSRIWTVKRNAELWSRIESYFFELMSYSDNSLDQRWLLAAAKQIRDNCTQVARASPELKGSPFVSCYVKRPLPVFAVPAAPAAAEPAADDDLMKE